MQGQKGAIGSSPEGLMEHGSSSTDSSVAEQQICWTNFIMNPQTDPNQETRNLTMWNMGESSSSSVSNQVIHHHDPFINMTHNHANNGHNVHNVTVSPSTFIGMKPSNYASSSSSGPFEMEARQRPCKRKATELTIGQSSSGLGQQDHAAENSHRNVRLTISNSRQQDQLPVINSNNDNGQLNNIIPSYPALGLNPVATTVENSSSHEGQSQPMLRVPSLRRNLNITSRNRSSSSRANRPVSSNIIGSSSGDNNNSRTIPTNISDHPLFIQPRDIRTANRAAVNLNLNSVGGNGNGNVTTANPVGSLGPRHGSALYPSRRLSEVLRWSLLSSVDSGGGGQNGNLFSRIPPPVGGASGSSSHESGIPPVIGITGHHPHQHPHHHHHLPHVRLADRQLDGVFGYPHMARTTTGGSERRGRLASEIRNVLDLIRRGEGLRFEDVMVLDQSVFYGMAGIYDRHRDMRLDIDNMSYEELLALEERIGNVNTGLTEDKVFKCLKPKTYTGHPDAEPCCICQEEYKNGDDLGELECGHDFHTNCIKQWLNQKNLCPVCKSAASK